MKATYVMVTYNRLELLKRTINAALSMTKKFDDIIIVDNNSNDGTKLFLDGLEQDNIKVFHLEKNIGGSGGFSFGVKKAMELTNNDWIFLADDDAIPEKDMLLKLEEGYDALDNKNEVAALCTSVINCGNIDESHRRRIKKGIITIKSENINSKVYENNFYVDEATFVGLLVKTDVVKNIGLPESDFFIYYDDTDYSYRINKIGKIVCIPQSKMNHDVDRSNNNMLSWRNYYSIRNYIYILKKHHAKRYYKATKAYYYLRKTSILAKLMKHRSKEDIILLKTAIRDGAKGNLGINDKYHPLAVKIAK